MPDLYSPENFLIKEHKQTCMVHRLIMFCNILKSTYTLLNPSEAPPPPPPPGLLSASPPRPIERPHLHPLHWKPVLRPPVTASSLWTGLPSLKIDKEQLEEQFKVLPHEQRKLSTSAKQRPKLLNVLDLKVSANL